MAVQITGLDEPMIRAQSGVIPDYLIRDLSGIDLGACGDYATTNGIQGEELDRSPDQS
jgi:hypothetical protein